MKSVRKHPMETYHGMVRSPADAIKLFEACRLGLLPRVQRRLSEKERQAIRSGSVFVWDEREAGMRRWTDGKSWSASRVSGSFLTYREMEGKRGGGFNTMRRMSGRTPDSSGRSSDDDQEDGEPDGYRYKADGLMKQSFSITTSSGQHFHLISYYARPSPGSPELPQPIVDPSLRNVVPAKGIYPEPSMSDSVPTTAVLRVGRPPHSHSHQQPPHYAQQPPPPPPPPPHYSSSHPSQPTYTWPLSPITTPPCGSHYNTTSSAPYPSQQPLHPGQYSPTASCPPPPGYYTGPSYSAHASYASAPPPQVAPAPSRPSLSHSRHPLYNSPPSMYHSTPVSLPASSIGPGLVPPYQTSPSSMQQSSSFVSQEPLPGLAKPASAIFSRALSYSGASSAAISAPTLRRGSSALTPPYQGPTVQKPYCGDAFATENLSLATAAGSRKASLAALLLPTPANSETNGTRSRSCSPRHQFAVPVGSGDAVSLTQQYLQPAPSGEDMRALSRLDKKLSI
ncbi:Gluconate transport-inducing protein [Sporothrix epigloea]|uniref:Gluconate transport-inducing protein n=1 Tax=Sporothrix epigloea TaxID=1892477 RepID=A0ABP0DP01_9PEZI